MNIPWSKSKREKRRNERTNEQTNEQMNEQTNERTNERTNKQLTAFCIPWPEEFFHSPVVQPIECQEDEWGQKLGTLQDISQGPDIHTSYEIRFKIYSTKFAISQSEAVSAVLISCHIMLTWPSWVNTQSYLFGLLWWLIRPGNGLLIRLVRSRPT